MPTLTDKLRKENDALKKQVKASTAKIDELEGRYQDLITKLENSTKEVVAGNDAIVAGTTNSSSNCCNNNGILAQILDIAKTTADDIKQFKQTSTDLQSSVKVMTTKIADFAQYSRINSLLFHNLQNVPTKVHGYEFAHFIVNTINHLLGGFLYYQLQLSDIEYAHILPTRTGKSKKPVVIVKFRNRFAKYDVYDNRKNLKGTGVSITEHLTAANLKGLGNPMMSCSLSPHVDDAKVADVVIHHVLRRPHVQGPQYMHKFLLVDGSSNL